MKRIYIFISTLIILNSSLIRSQDGWYWQNPLPQGNTLTSIAQSNLSTILAVGYGGAILRSKDFGINWKNLISNKYVDNKKLYFQNESTGFIIRQDNTILRTTNSGAIWDSVYSSSISINGICFNNTNTGIFFGNSQQVYKTTNNGNNWFPISTIPVDNLQLFEGQFLNDNDIICVGRTYVFVPPYYGYTASIITKSTNGGLDWMTKSSETNKIATSVNFINECTGFVSGDNAYFMRTYNGGDNWIPGSIGQGYNSFRIKFLDSLYGYSIGNNYISMTSDGGLSWNTNICPVAINDCIPISRKILIGVGSLGDIIRSSNFGINWENLKASDYSNRLSEIFSVSDSIMIAGGDDGDILKTYNYGKNWGRISTGINTFITSIYFIDNSTGFITTPSFIYKTINGGYNWNQIYDSAYYIEHIQMLNANTGFFCGREHTLKKTTNGGIDWIDKNIATQLTYYSKVIFLDNQTGFVVARFASGTTPAIFKTTNGGDNWSGYSGPVVAEDIYFINSSTGFTAGYDGEIYKTTNGGINWISHSYPTNSVLKSIAFINDNTGYIVGYIHTILLRTTDCGENWQKITTGLERDDYFLWGITSRNGFATFVGDNGIVKSTRNIHNVSVNNNITIIPNDYSLYQNFPNPFNSSTRIKYEINKISKIKIIVFDILGREIQFLVNEMQTPGTYETIFDASSFPSGVYFYRLTADGYSETRKMVLLK